MVTRISAKEARKTADNARRVIEDRRNKEKELNKAREKQREYIRIQFDKQRKNIIAAAIDLETEIEANEIINYKELLGFEIQIIEEGRVTKERKYAKEVNWHERLRIEIVELFDRFIDDSKSDLKQYYGGFKDFHRLNYEALNEVLNSESSWDVFSGDDIYFEDVSYELKNKYEEYLDKINEKISLYKRQSEDWNFDNDDADSDSYGDGEYYFGDDDDDIEILKPSVAGNRLKIRWIKEDVGKFMSYSRSPFTFSLT